MNTGGTETEGGGGKERGILLKLEEEEEPVAVGLRLESGASVGRRNKEKCGKCGLKTTK